jgi:hypothetical protein
VFNSLSTKLELGEEAIVDGLYALDILYGWSFADIFFK